MKPTYTEKDFGPQNADRVREALVGKTLPHAIRNLRDLELSAPPDEKALRKTQHLERDQQIAYFDRVRGCLDQDGRALPHRPGADLIHAIGNENAAGRAMGVLRWLMGVKKGMPDICIPIPRGEFHALYIELKREDGVASDVRDEQRLVHNALWVVGCNVLVAYGWRRAWAVTCDYLGWED